MGIFHQAENIIMERFTLIIMYEHFVVINLRNVDLKIKPFEIFKFPNFKNYRLLFSQYTSFAVLY